MTKKLKKKIKVKTRLEDTSKTSEYLKSLPKIYMLGRWAKYGIWEFPYSGYSDERGIPYVYKYEDSNGMDPRYVLIPITRVTTGQIFVWNDYKPVLEHIKEAMEAGEN